VSGRPLGGDAGSHVAGYRAELGFVFGEELTAASDLQLMEYRGVHKRRQAPAGLRKALLGFVQYGFLE
jgi:hypothetical protein